MAGHSKGNRPYLNQWRPSFWSIYALLGPGDLSNPEGNGYNELELKMKIKSQPQVVGFLEYWYHYPVPYGSQQGKSEGFESCDWPIVRKRPIWVKIGDALYCVTLKFDGWPWKTIGHLSFAVSSFVQHFIAIGEFKLELQSGNAHFGSN